MSYEDQHRLSRLLDEFREVGRLVYRLMRRRSNGYVSDTDDIRAEKIRPTIPYYLKLIRERYPESLPEVLAIMRTFELENVF